LFTKLSPKSGEIEKISKQPHLSVEVMDKTYFSGDTIPMSKDVKFHFKIGNLQKRANTCWRWQIMKFDKGLVSLLLNSSAQNILPENGIYSPHPFELDNHFKEVEDCMLGVVIGEDCISLDLDFFPQSYKSKNEKKKNKKEKQVYSTVEASRTIDANAKLYMFYFNITKFI